MSNIHHPTDVMHLRLTFEDTTSKAKQEKFCTRSRMTFEHIKQSIGNVVHTEFKNNIHWNWRLIAVEQVNQLPYWHKEHTHETN